MKVLKKVFVVVMSLALVFTLAACDNNSNAGNSGGDQLSGDMVAIVENSASSYTVVRPREGSKLESDLAVNLRKEIEETTGASLGIANDNMSDPTEYEILVGKTNRAESQEVYANLKENEYVIKWVGKKLVIAGYDDLMISKAYDYFINNFVAGQTANIGVPEGFNNSYILPTREEQLAQNALVAYTEYPEQVKRDYDYTVTVTQGDKTITIPVYNEIRQVNNFSSVQFGDTYRRFCEFAFSGDPVTISIAVHQDMEKYLVAPSSKGYETTVDGNVVSFEVDEPGQIVFKINGDNNSLLSIFADQVEIEEEIPTSFADNVIYYGPGWHDVEGNVVKVPQGYTLYLAPGAVLNARVHVTGDNTTVMGRGMVRDPENNRMDTDAPYVFWVDGSKNVTLKDIKVVDGRAFSFVLMNVTDSTATNLKVLSNQISTDGFSCFGTCDNINVDGSYMHVTDNIFVFGSTLSNLTIKNCVVGADYALIYPQTNVGPNVVFDNIDVFRCASFFKNTQYSENPVAIDNLLLQNIRVNDIDNQPIFMWLQGQGNATKTITMKNISIADVTDTEAIRAYNGGGYTFNYDNVWIGGELFTSLSQLDVLDSISGTVYNFASTNDKAAAMAGIKNEHDAFYTAVKIKIGEWLLGGLSYPAYEENGTAYVAIADLLEELGYEVEVKDGTMTYGSNTATVEMKDGVAVAPISFLTDNNITTVSYDASTKTVNVSAIAESGNLLSNPDFEEGFTPEWITFNFGKTTLTDDAHSGNYAMQVLATENASGGAAGVSQYVSEILYKNGAGTYRLEAWAKLHNTTVGSDIYFGILPSSWQVPGDDYDTITLSNSWQKITYEFTVDDVTEYDRNHLYIGSDSTLQTFFIVDDVSFTKVG